jgi:predicted GIY-YIG superfamily endonuclease
MKGKVYLLHFARPYRHARHYLGWTDDLEERLARHRDGRGARLLAVVTEAGIEWTVARVWDGSRALERRLKSWHKARALCPLCREEVHGRHA